MSTTFIPRSISQLVVYQGEDQNVYGVNPVSGHVFQLTGLAQAPPNQAPPPTIDTSQFVQKAGDTMTGQLAVQGNAFSVDDGGNSPAVIIENSTGAGAGMTLGRYQDSVCFHQKNGTPAVLRLDGRIEITDGSSDYLILNTNGMIDWNIAGQGHVRMQIANGDLVVTLTIAGAALAITDNSGVNSVRLMVDANADLVAHGTGPNAGKSVNLTAGKWV